MNVALFEVIYPTWHSAPNLSFIANLTHPFLGGLKVGNFSKWVGGRWIGGGAAAPTPFGFPVSQGGRLLLMLLSHWVGRRRRSAVSVLGAP